MTMRRTHRAIEHSYKNAIASSGVIADALDALDRTRTAPIASLNLMNECKHAIEDSIELIETLRRDIPQ